MSAVLKMLKGNRSLEEALQARVDRIVANGKRSSGYVMRTTKEGGYSQAILYPAYAAQLAALKKPVEDESKTRSGDLR